MSSKFKPKKKKSAAVVDDWDASDPEESAEEIRHLDKEGQLAAPIERASPLIAMQKDAWEDEEADFNRGSVGAGVDKLVKRDGRMLWQEANRAEPQPQPVLSNRSLPSTVLSPRLYSPAPSSGDVLQYTEAPPPQILRRDKAGYGRAVANDKGNEKKKSLKEREEEYRKARERIFGTPTPTESPPPSSKGRTQGNSNGNSNSQQQKKSQGSR